MSCTHCTRLAAAVAAHGDMVAAENAGALGRGEYRADPGECDCYCHECWRLFHGKPLITRAAS